MTVDEYRQLPDREDVIQELHCGALVTLARPKMKHVKLQFKLVELLRPTAEHLGVVETEVAFRALPEYDLHGTDIAYVSQHRWDSTSDADNLHGSPELVIEVLSPSNTKAEIREKRSSACRAEHRSSGWSTRNGKPSASPAKAASQRSISWATAFPCQCSAPIWMYPKSSLFELLIGVAHPGDH